MNKFFFVLFLLISIGLYITNKDQVISDKFRFVNDFKKYYFEKIIEVEQTLTKYFSQVNTIDELRAENSKLKEYEALYIKTKTELDEVLKLNESEIKTTQDKLKDVKVLSYVDLDDNTKVWLDLRKSDSQIEGLITENFAAGIVVNKSNQALALLNGNEKSNYAVFIGDKKAPGIIHGLGNSKLIVAKYVPIWININIGDEVITSGMDNIFFEGLKVGKVTALKKMPDMQEATIEPYANVISQTHFLIYTKKIEEPILKEEEVEKASTNKKP